MNRKTMTEDFDHEGSIASETDCIVSFRNERRAAIHAPTGPSSIAININSVKSLEECIASTVVTPLEDKTPQSHEICLNNLASSAYKNSSDPLLHFSNKSLMKIMNNKGPRIEPWGIPLSTSLQKEKKPLILTLCRLFNRKDFLLIYRLQCDSEISFFLLVAFACLYYYDFTYIAWL